MAYNPNDFNASTDTPSDKVLEVHTGSYTALARYDVFQPRLTEFSIPTGVGDYAFPSGSYSTDGGTTWLPLGSVNADTSSSAPSFQTWEVTAYCTATSLVMVTSNYLAANRTIMFAIQLLSKD